MNDHESDTTLHFVDCIVQDDEKSDSFVALSCLEAGLHALHQHFPHLKQVILQSDNAKNFFGKDMKMFVHQAVSFHQQEWSCLHITTMKQQQERMYVTPTLPTNKQGWMPTFRKAMVEGRFQQLTVSSCS